MSSFVVVRYTDANQELSVEWLCEDKTEIEITRGIFLVLPWCLSALCRVSKVLLLRC